MNLINPVLPQALADGDDAFYRINTFLPAHKLEPGTAADATNKRFEDGRAWPRFGIASEGWGCYYPNLVPKGATADFVSYFLEGLTPGAQYTIHFGANEIGVIDPVSGSLVEKSVVGNVYVFTAPASGLMDLYYSTPNAAVTARVFAEQTAKPVGFARYNDPQGFDSAVLLTDEWRTGAGEDGGRGRAWRIVSGNEPQEIALNGHDVWDTSRIVPCYNGCVLLRTGDERHYVTNGVTFSITDTDATADTLTIADTGNLLTGRPCTVTGITGTSGTYYIRVVSETTISLYDTNAHAVAGGATGKFNVTVNDETGTLTRLGVNPVTYRLLLNVETNLTTGDKVRVHLEENAVFSGTTVPLSDSGYYVKLFQASNGLYWDVELYTDAGLTTQLQFTSLSGSVYLERQADNPGFFGNGAPPLIAQPNALGNTLWDGGFISVPSIVSVTDTSSVTNYLTAANHGLLPGDYVELSSGITLTGAATANHGYARPVNDTQFMLYTTQLGALAGDSTKLITLTSTETGTVKKATASGLPMPPGRLGAYFQNRLLLVNGQNTLAVSDPLDPLHFAPLTNSITANLGESDAINAVFPFGDDAVLVLKENTVQLLGNFSAGPSAWTLSSITREYGCIAPETVAQCGSDVWFLSRKGVAAINNTVASNTQGVAEPVSKPVQKYIDRIDWNYAEKAAAGYWNNRYFLAVPLKGQITTVKNNCLLVYNFLMQGWEGVWTGDTLLPFGLARHLVNGEERLTFCDDTGQVRWFTDGFTDDGEAIADSLTTRRYTASNMGRKLWLAGEIIWDTNNPSLSVYAVPPGYKEDQALASGVAYENTAYLIYGQADYDASTSTTETFEAPHRADYSLSPEELLVGEMDVHQNITEPVRMRVDGWGLQLRIENASGSCRLQSVRVNGAQRDMMSVRK